MNLPSHLNGRMVSKGLEMLKEVQNIEEWPLVITQLIYHNMTDRFIIRVVTPWDWEGHLCNKYRNYAYTISDFIKMSDSNIAFNSGYKRICTQTYGHKSGLSDIGWYISYMVFSTSPIEKGLMTCRVMKVERVPEWPDILCISICTYIATMYAL